MSKKVLSVLAVVVSVLILFTLLAGCAKQKENTDGTQSGTVQKESSIQETTAEKPKEPAKLSYFGPAGGRIHKEDNSIVKEVEKLTNTQLEIILVPDAEFVQKFNAILASNDLYDIIRTGGYSFSQYTTQGAFIELDNLLKEKGKNILSYVSEDIWNRIKLNGKIYSVPSINVAGKFVYNMRKDWLDSLQLQVPETLDDFYNALKKIKENKKDVYPMGGYGGGSMNFMPVYGAYGIYPGIYTMQDGKVYAHSISNEYKESLKFIKKLFDEKLVDPDVLIEGPDEARQKILLDKTGAFLSWWSIVPAVLIDQYKMMDTIPDAKWALVPPFKGSDGKSGMLASTLISSSTSISKDCKDPEAAMGLLDFLISDDGAKLAAFGIKGLHWEEKDGNFNKRTPEGKTGYDEKWLDELHQIVFRADLTLDAYKVENEKYAEYVDGAAKNELIYNLFEGLSTSEQQTLGQDLAKFESESFIKFVTGNMDIEKFDQYVSEWKQKGGEKINQSLLNEYNKLRGTNYTLGN